MTSRGDLGRRPSLGRVLHKLSMLIRIWYDFPFCFALEGADFVFRGCVDSVVVCELCNDALSFYGPELDVNCIVLSFICVKFLLIALQNRPTLSYQRLQTAQPLTDSELYDKIRRSVPNKHELQVLESFLIFNKFVSMPFPFL